MKGPGNLESVKVNIYTSDNQQNMDPQNVYLCERSCVFVYVYASLVYVIVNVCLCESVCGTDALFRLYPMRTSCHLYLQK